MHCCIPTPTTDSNTSTGMIWVTLNMLSAAEECRKPSRKCQGISRCNVRKNWLKWHKVKNYKDTLHSHNVSSQLAEVIVMMGTTLWTDEISGIDGMMTEWTLQWQWAADYSKPWCRQQRKIGHRALTFGLLARRTLTSWKIWGAVVTPNARPVVTAQRCQAVLTLEHQYTEFVLDSLLDTQPVEVHQYWCDMWYCLESGHCVNWLWVRNQLFDY